MRISELDMEFFNYGLIHGALGGKKVEGERLENFGKQGVIIIPNEKQQISYALGLKIGKSKIIQGLNDVKYKQTQGKKPLRTRGDILTLALADRQGIRGQYVDIPVYFKNSEIIVQEDYKGVVGFQLKLKYDTELLDFISITKASSWEGTLQIDTSTSGVLSVQGLKQVAEKEDIALCYIRFYVKSTVSEYLSEIPLRQEGSIGTGAGSELFTYDKDGDLAYIVPLKLENGAVLLEAKEVEPIGSITIPSSGTSTIGTGNSSVSYDFTATVGHPVGLTPSGGVSAYVNVYLDGVLIGQEKVQLEDGEHTYKGKIPISLPSLKTGKITYEIVIEDEDGFHYVFIKAGALFILETEVQREEVNELSDLSRLKALNADIVLGSLLTINLVEAKEPVNITELNTNIALGSILTIDLIDIIEPIDLNGTLTTNIDLGSITTINLVKPPVQLDPTQLETGVKLGSITIIKGV